MKNLEKICMLIAFVSAFGSMIVSMYTGNSWSWQLATIMWVFVAYLKQKLIQRYQNLIQKLSK
jgi:hypothetical protein